MNRILLRCELLRLKRRRYEQNSDEIRASKRQSLARELRSRTTVTTLNILLLGNKHGIAINGSYMYKRMYGILVVAYLKR